jgi:hypothetical protein
MAFRKIPRNRLSLEIAAIVWAIAGSAILSSCGYNEDKAAAETGVRTFHSQLNSGEMHAIYTGADDAFQKATSEPDFDAFMGAVHRKLGDVERSELTNYRVGYFTGQGTVVTLVYQSQFAGGSGTEEFAWHIRDKHPFLVRYTVNSNALVLK